MFSFGGTVLKKQLNKVDYRNQQSTVNTIHLAWFAVSISIDHSSVG